MASTLAESAAELAAEQLVNHGGGPVDEADSQGTLRGMVTYSAASGGEEKFTLTGVGTTKGLTQATATVYIDGHINGTDIVIEHSLHH